MMIRNSALVISLTVISSTLVAHNHNHLSKEELISLIIKQEQVIETKERINEKKDHIIAKQKECIVCLEDELAHIKHKLHEKHRYHALKKALHELFGF